MIIYGENHPNHKLTDAQVTEMRQLYSTGNWLLKDLAERYGISLTCACNAVRAMSWRHTAARCEKFDHRRRGEAHQGSILTEQDVKDIRRLYRAGGITQTKLGEVYGVSQNRISKIVNGHGWQHVPDESEEDSDEVHGN